MKSAAEEPSSSVWITGIGVVGPQGCGWDALCQALSSPRSYFLPVPTDWSRYVGVPDAYIAPLGETAGDDLKRFEDVSRDRACAMAMCAAEQAWNQSGLSASVDGDPNDFRGGVYWGTGMGGLHSTAAAFERLLVDKARLSPMTVVRIMGNSAAAQLAMKYKLKGPNQTYSVACASSAMAIGEASVALRDGRIDFALVGGSEAMLTPAVMSAWGALRVLSTRQAAPDIERACRPFSGERCGMVIGEGGAALVLEDPQHAMRRGARPLAELIGYGSTCDANSLVNPQMSSQVEAMRFALNSARLKPQDIHVVNAHATGTETGDVVEAQALATIFATSPSTRVPPVCATKSIHGHLLGAAGALAAAVSVASLQQQSLPPTLGAMPLDEHCKMLDVAPSAARPMVNLQHVMSNSFAFGGANVVLIFKKSA